MRAVIRTLGILVFCAGLFGQTPPALDVVLLVEDSIPATGLVRRPDLSALRPGDRMAVMTFSKKPSLKLALEGDRAKIDQAMSKIDSKGPPSTTRLWDAVAKATDLFNGPRDPSRRRAIFLVFLADDKSSAQTADSIRAALRRSEASLNAVTAYSAPAASAIPRISKVPSRTPAPQTPDVWSERVPVTEGRVLPDLTLGLVEALASETGGLVLKNEWSFTKLAEHARSR